MKAWVVAALVSGVPSTAHAVATGGDPLAATRAAGSLLVGDDAAPAAQIAAALPAHLALSWFWGGLVARALPRDNRALWGAAAGLAIAAVDLGTVGRRKPAISRLPLAPQLADHALFGAVVGTLTRG
jgi:hypothetical protein